MDELEALIILNNTPLLGPVKSRQLIKRFGSAENALLADIAEVSVLPGFGTKIVNSLRQWKENPTWKEDLDLIARDSVELIPFTDPDYPKRLLELSDAPLVLYVSGKLTPRDKSGIAVIGTRQATLYGREMAERIGRELALLGYTIVSGFARGIDTIAHQAALQSGKGARTVAVLGSGLRHIYPPENAALVARVREQGALISEFPMNTPPDRQHFPQRNRIVSGMTLGTVLIEAPVQSGAMLTMNRGREQGRKLFALPGRADSDAFRGNHLLIKQGIARLIESGQDVAEALGSLFAFAPIPPAERPQRPLVEGDEYQLLSQLPDEEATIDEIAELTKLPIVKLNVLLMSLVLKKQVKEFPGKVYKRAAFQTS